jgi:hypothetical protein
MEYTNHHSKYNLAYCEIFNSKIHGKNSNSSKNIESHFLIFRTLCINEFYTITQFIPISDFICTIRGDYIRNDYSLHLHPVIRNYNEILIKKHYISLEIIECIELEGGEHVAIYKTFWLRIIQRKWKRYYESKKKRVAALLQPYGFFMREIGITLQHSRPLLVSNLKFYNSRQ